MTSITIPLIKNIDPCVVAQDIIGVQPMTNESSMSFTLRYELEEPTYKQGEIRHVFGRGWECYYGDEWIPENLWWTIKISGL